MAERSGRSVSAREPLIVEQRPQLQALENEAASQDFEPAPQAPPPRVSLFKLFAYTSKGDRLILLVAILGCVVQGTTGPLMAKFTRSLFTSIFWPNDNGTLPPEEGDHTERDKRVLEGMLTFLILALCAFVSTALGNMGFAFVADNITLRLRRAFFTHLLDKDVGWYDLNSSAEMATRLTIDTYDFRQGVGEKLASLISAMVQSPVGFIVAFSIDFRLTLMMFVAIPILVCVFSIAGRVMTRAATAQQEFYASAGGIAETTISSIRTVAAFNGFQRELDKYDAKLREAEVKGIRAGWAGALANGGAIGGVYGTFALGFFLGSLLVINDYNHDCWKKDPPFGDCFTGSTMLSVLFAVLQGAGALGAIPSSFAALATARGAAARIYAIIDQPPAFAADVGSALLEVAGTVEFRDVTFSYPTRPDKPALDHVSFVVPAGKTAAFVGPSGSGKSTSIALLQRFYDPHSGAVCLDGHDIRSLSLTWLRSKMALVQQEPILFSGTIAENISYGRPGATRREWEEAGKAANAHAFITSFPAGYKTEVGERGAQLSGGQKQRVAIARAIIRDPKILLLDEATSALDTESERVVQKALDDLLAQGSRTTLVVAHRLSTIRNADQILVLEDGRLLEHGTHKELMATSGSLYAQLVELQNIAGVDAPELQRQLSQRTPTSLMRTSSGGQTPTGPSLGRQRSGPWNPPPMNARLSSGGNRSSTEGDQAAETDAQEAPAEDDEHVPVPLSRLWALQRPDIAFVVFALVCTVPNGAARPLMGFMFSDLTNLFSQPPATFDFHARPPRWVGNMDVDDVREKANLMCLKFAILGGSLLVCTAGQVGGFRRSAESLTRRLRAMTFRAMLRQEISWFDVRLSGHLADRLAAEAPLVKSFMGESLAGTIQVGITLCTGLGIAVYHSWKLTLCAAAFLPFMVMSSVIVRKATQKTQDTRAGPIVSEAMGNIRTVAAFALQSKMLEKYGEVLSIEGAEESKKSMATTFAQALSGSIMYVMFGAIIFIANVFISNDWILPSDVLNVLFPVIFASTGTVIASQWQSDKAKGQRAVNHIFHTLDRVPAIDAYDDGGDKLPEVRGEIRFEHVAFCYPSRPDITVFADFHLEIPAGTTVAFCGPSGSGKSTTIALLERFYDADAGRVLFDGYDVKTLNIAWLRSQMALVQQEPVLFAGTIRENIRYGREDATDEECEVAAKSANAHGFVREFPQGYATDVGDRGSQLSGGQKQRIAIARSMIRDPKVLLLDEATSALDTESERVVQEALDALLAQSRRTTLVIAHRLSTIVNSDKICVIYQGRIVEQGKHAELMRIKDGHYKQLVSRQHAN